MSSKAEGGGGKAEGTNAELPLIPGGWGEVAASIPVAGENSRTFRLLVPADPDAVLEECARTGGDPYWATLWPAATTLAGRLLADPPGRGAEVLELGCGSALAGLAAAAGGADVTATDLDPRAVALAAANARLNDLPLAAFVLDWNSPPGERYEAVIGADLLYQPSLHAPLLATLAATLAEGGTALLSDPGRTAAAAFVHAADAAGWRVRVENPDGSERFAPRLGGHQLVRLTR